MDANYLICTERQLLPRLFDFMLTLIAWIAFTTLVYQGLIIHLFSNELLSWQIVASSLKLMAMYFLLTTMDGILLITWLKYNKFYVQSKSDKKTYTLATTELASSLNIDPGMLMSMFRANRFTVHHATSGEIQGINM